MDRWVKIPGRATIAENCKRDPKKPRYALVPQGKTCAFCTMLAGRGFVYKSEKTAHKMHNHCDCVACPEWDANPNKIRGYNPDALSDEWDKAKKIVWEKNKAKARKNGKDASEVVEPTWQEVVVQLRKTRGLCSDGRVVKYPKNYPTNVKHISDRVWEHIMEGDANGKGGHAAWSSNPGKTKFPDNWDSRQIQKMVMSVITNPSEDVIIKSKNRRSLIAVRYGIKIEVRLSKKKKGWRVNTAFPVVENKKGVRS